MSIAASRLTPVTAPRPADGPAPVPLRRARTELEIAESREFRDLVRRRWIVSSALLAILFATYYGYILLIPYARAFMVARVGGATTRAILAGAAVIVLSFLLTAVYVVWANRSYDPEVDRLRRELRS